MRIFVDEVIDHMPPELTLVVPDIIGDAELAADPPRTLGHFEGAALRHHEPLAIALKAAGMTRKNFAACLEELRVGGAPQLPEGRDPADLQGLFDSLSYNKAQVLLTYWSWRFGSSDV